MSLKEFLEYKTHCPLCSTELSIYFSSKAKKQTYNLTENFYSVKRPLYDIKRNYKYFIDYVFDLNHNTFHIDFYSGENNKIQYVSCKLLNTFQIFNANIKWYNFYKCCDKCNRYNYISNTFTFDLTNATHNSIVVSSEYLGLAENQSNGHFKMFRIVNSFFKNETIIEYGIANHTEFINTKKNNYLMDDLHFDSFKFNLMPFSNEKDMINRINKLIVFS